MNGHHVSQNCPGQETGQGPRIHKKVLRNLLSGRGYTTPVERLVFAMVANRTLAPSSKLGMEHWVASEALIDGLPEVEVHQLCRAMDFLLEAAEEHGRQDRS